jgi:jouberin
MHTILVHSRDNCIRLIEYESSRGPRVKQRFFGARCSNMPCQSTISTDGQFIISGSEDGRPRIWDTSFESMQSAK